MEYAKDEIFQIRYNTKLDRLEMKGESWTSRLSKKIKRHKLIRPPLPEVRNFSRTGS